MPYDVAKATVTTSGSVTRLQKMGYCNFMLMSETWRFVLTDTQANITSLESVQSDPQSSALPIVRVSQIKDMVN